MLRGYRSIILALGLVLAGAGEPPRASQEPKVQAVQSELAKAAETVSAAISSIKAPVEESPPCDPGKDNRNSDLCAQWKAADAAANSAWWAWVSGLAGIVSLFGVIFALVLALHSNWIARDTAKRQLRAYISIEPGGINEVVDGIHRVPFNIINNGQTPAYEMEHGGDFLIVEGNPMEFDPSINGRLTGQTATTDQSLGPNSNRFSYAYLEAALCAPFLDKIDAKEASIVHYGYVTYKDVFGISHRTSFAFYHWGEELSDLESKRCRFGNDAT